MFFLEEWFLWLFFLTGVVIILVFHRWKRKHFSSEQRRKATNLLLEKNLTRRKIGGVVLIILFVANFGLDIIYGYEKLARAVIFIPLWFGFIFFTFKNRRILMDAGFPQEQIRADFYYGIFLISWWGAFLLLLLSK